MKQLEEAGAKYPFLATEASAELWSIGESVPNVSMTLFSDTNATQGNDQKFHDKTAQALLSRISGPPSAQRGPRCTSQAFGEVSLMLNSKTTAIMLACSWLLCDCVSVERSNLRAKDSIGDGEITTVNGDGSRNVQKEDLHPTKVFRQ